MALAAASLALASCARPPAPTPPAPPARALPAAGYDRRIDSLPALPSRLLAGRRVAIDPGHGGLFRGALGVGGLTEAEANLAVSLRLAALLRASGAEVMLTRETDRDFLTLADSSLRADLAARVRLSNAWGPDVFISVHHNADPSARHDVNETQVYFQLGDDGPALELAEDVHRSLTRNLGIAISRLIPGNFHVVRHSEAPALLSEASHITFPPVEAKLRTAEAQQLEAEALHLGLLRYFARRAPVIESLAVDAGAGGDPARPVVTARIRGPFDSADLRIDGEPVPPEVRGGALRWQPAAPLANGAHTLTLRARLAGEGTSRTESVTFRVDAPLAALTLDFPGQRGWRHGEPVGVRVRASARGGAAIRDSLRVRVRTHGATPADTVVEVRDGEAWAFLMPSRTRGRGSALRVGVSRAGAAGGPGAGASLASAPEGASRSAFVLVSPADTAWHGSVPAAAASWLQRDGFVTHDPASGPWRQPALAGWRPAGTDSAWPPRVVAMAGGALHGRRIAIDPEGGGDEPGGVGPSGTRASSLNLQVARALAAMLRAAGAEVRLVREDEAPVSEVTRVQLAEAFAAERYVRIAHRPGAPSAGHYFSSGGGRRWATRLAALLPALGLPPVEVGESARYPIAQVSAVALDASLARIDRDETRLLEPGTLRREAHALYAALAADLLGRDLEVERTVVRGSDGRPAAHALVSAGGVLLVQADAGGEVRLVRTESTPAPLEVLDPPR